MVPRLNGAKDTFNGAGCAIAALYSALFITRGENMPTEEIIEILLMYLKAFAVGGAICVIAQIIINITSLTSGKILVFFMLAGVVLTALGLYQPLVEFAGAGATVPISGFGYLLANGAIKGAEKGFFYAVTGSLSAASAGVTAAVVFSLIMSLIFHSKTKRN